MRLPPLLLGTALALAACSGSGNLATETAGNAVYNATYAGPGAFQRTAGDRPIMSPIVGGIQTTRVTLTLSQLGSNYSGVLSAETVLARGGVADTTTYAGGVTGHVTGTGGTLTLVPTGSCPGVLYGSFTLEANGALTGSLTGHDCASNLADENVHVTFAGLVRQ